MSSGHDLELRPLPSRYDLLPVGSLQLPRASHLKLTGETSEKRGGEGGHGHPMCKGRWEESNDHHSIP